MAEIFRKLDERFQHILVHSGQHVDANLSDVFFDELKIRQPDYNLGIGLPGRDHVEQQALLGPAIINLIRNEKLFPDVVLFLGDSNSALAAIPLKKEGIKIGHIEAGMRSGDEWMPEEINRICCDHVSNFLFAYHADNCTNLMKEGIPEDRIHIVGNTIVEIARPILADLTQTQKTGEYILVDIHRHENIMNPSRLAGIINLVQRLQKTYNLPVLWIDFKRTRQALETAGLNILHNLGPGGLKIMDPTSYKHFMALQYNAAFMISDSGTAQEEPALLGTPVIVPRSFTERPQSINGMCSIMVDVGLGGNLTFQMPAINLFLVGHQNGAFCPATSWLGDGQTAERIVTILTQLL
jgi:UDP-N-acetylglucosamine 2-epimerase (non-hydrolysing)